jgi:hypothetical protein
MQRMELSGLTITFNQKEYKEVIKIQIDVVSFGYVLVLLVRGSLCSKHTCIFTIYSYLLSLRLLLGNV